MDDVHVERDKVYKSIDNLELKYDVYRPPQSNPELPLPAVVLVHGEGPPEVIENSKNWGQYEGWGRLFAVSGMVAVAFNHRSSHFFSQLAEPANDVEDLLDHILDSRLEPGIDPERLGLWVCSGGTPFGMNAGLDRGVHCIAAYYGRMSLTPIREEIEGGVSDTEFANYSAAAKLSEMQVDKVPPMLIAKAELDDLVGVNESIDEAIEIARARNLPITVLRHERGEHGMDVRNDDEGTREIIAQTLEFFGRHLGAEGQKRA